MKIIKHDGDLYIKADDLIEAINNHGELVKGNNAWSDKNLEEAYISAHKHIQYMIEGELKAHKEVNDAGNHNNSNNLCHIGDDLMDQQEEVRIELAKRLLADEAFMNQLMAITQSLATAVMPVVNSIMNVMAQEIEESLSE